MISAAASLIQGLHGLSDLPQRKKTIRMEGPDMLQ